MIDQVIFEHIILKAQTILQYTRRYRTSLASLRLCNTLASGVLEYVGAFSQLTYLVEVVGREWGFWVRNNYRIDWTGVRGSSQISNGESHDAFMTIETLDEQ